MGVKRGVERHDGAMIKLGALDMSGGLLWLGWDLVGWQQPLFIASYMVLHPSALAPALGVLQSCA